MNIDNCLFSEKEIEMEKTGDLSKLKECEAFKPKSSNSSVCNELVYLEGMFPRLLHCSSHETEFMLCPYAEGLF